MKVLVLWDVDHTLVENSGVSKETYAAAFSALAGYPPQHQARTSGRTDRLIMREMFAAHGEKRPDWPTICGALEEAGRTRFEAMRERGSFLPGVRAALTALAEAPGVVQSPLTGNIQANARMKVTASGVGEYFDLAAGGYGDDSEKRADLVAVAQGRAVGLYGCDFTKSNTVLVGDTPRDVEAGRQGGARVVAVASGVHSIAQLSAADDAIVLPDLRDTAALLAAIQALTS